MQVSGSQPVPNVDRYMQIIDKGVASTVKCYTPFHFKQNTGNVLRVCYYGYHTHYVVSPLKIHHLAWLTGFSSFKEL